MGTPGSWASGQAAGQWARKNTPRWFFNVFDLSDRMGITVRYVKFLLSKYNIPSGHIKRVVKLANGELRMRTLRIITPSALELLLARHAGLTRSHPNRVRVKRRA